MSHEQRQIKGPGPLLNPDGSLADVELKKAIFGLSHKMAKVEGEIPRLKKSYLPWD